MRAALEYERRPFAPAYMLRAFWPGARRVTSATALSARWRGHRVDAGQLAAFSRITGLPEGPTLPLLYPHTIGFRLSMAVLTHPRAPAPIWRVLQIRSSLLEHRPIASDAVLDFEARATAARVLEKGLELDLRTTVHVRGELAWESLVTFYARGRFGPPGAPSPLSRAPDLAGAPLADEWTMRDDAHWRFGALTGDYNGIHAWDWYARHFGFSRALYHPPRVLGQCLARLSDPPAPRRLDAWLKGPVPHGAAVRLHARSDGGATLFSLHVEPERPSIAGALREAAPGARLVDDQGAPLDPRPE